MYFTFFTLGGLLSLYIAYTYNTLIRLKNNVIESFSSIDAALQNRQDLVPKLIAVVQGYMLHEARSFEKTSGVRSMLLSKFSSGSDSQLDSDEYKGNLPFTRDPIFGRIQEQE